MFEGLTEGLSNVGAAAGQAVQQAQQQASAAARIRRREATVGDVLAIRRAYRALQAKARRLGLAVDHIVPLAGCRVCGAKGLHEPSNWQMLTSVENAKKGNRCVSCSVKLRT